MTQELKVHYEGADLLLTFDRHATANLRINGIERDFDSGDSNFDVTDVITLKLTSSVQTAYEWHELIEAVVVYNTGTITASILASKKELIATTVARDG